MTRTLCAASALVLSACSGAARTEPSPALNTRAEQGDCAVAVELDRDHLTVAERLRLKIRTSHPEDHELAPPALEQQLSAWTIAEEARAPEVLDTKGCVRAQRELLLEPFLPGRAEIPALRFVFRRRAGVGPEINLTTEVRVVTVNSVLTGAEAGEPAPARGVVELPAQGWSRATTLGAALVILLIAIGVWRRRRRVPPAPPAPPRPAHERALAAIEALLARGLLERGEVRVFFSELAELLRGYVEERFGLMAPERTTEELLAEARRSALIPGTQAKLLGDFLAACDLVKFARAIPARQEADEGVGAARRFISETIEPEQKPEPNIALGRAP